MDRGRLGRIRDGVLIALVLIGAVLFIAGRSDDANSSNSLVPTTEVGRDPFRFPADRIVWQVDQVSSDPTDIADAAHRPSITIYGDGRVFLLQPAHDPRYDQPIPLLTGTIDPDLLLTFVDFVEDSGLLDPSLDLDETFGRPDDEDLFTTTISVHGRGGPHSIEVYGLGGRFDADVGSTQARNRDRLRQLLHEAKVLLDEPEPAPPENLRVLHLVDDATFEEKPEVDDPDEKPEWPGPALSGLDDPPPTDLDPALVEGCGSLRGDDAVDLFTSALENPTPHWLVDDHSETVIVVALLPTESACG